MGAPAPLPTLHFSTRGLREQEAFEIWNDAISVVFDTSPPARGIGRFTAAVTAWHAGNFVVSDTRFGAQRFERPLRKLRRDGLDHVLLQLYCRGGYAGTAERQPLRVGPGDVSVLDMTRPVSTVAARSDTVSLVIPRRTLDGLVNVDGLHGMVLT
ncbi:MAG: helix-turn-helix domain-containing protein, partial [Solimonas sp.]